MPLEPGWFEISIRLLCAFASGAVIGLNRSERGRAAGMRTSILVCLAASIAMIQVNLLLPLSGRGANSFVMNDLMRLPLGILSGMGFIGGGAILHRKNLVVGVTTAATLWILTVIGLCYGGGQIRLGIVGSVLALFVLAGLRIVEDRSEQTRHACCRIVASSSGAGEEEVRELFLQSGFNIQSCGLIAEGEAGTRTLTCDVSWKARAETSAVPDAVYRLANRTGIMSVEWTPEDR